LIKKDVISISITPQVHEEFTDLVVAKHPDGDATVSSHIETIMKREIAKLRDSNAPDSVDVDALRRQISDLEKRIDSIVKELQKHPDLIAAFNQLAEDYHIDDTYATVDTALRRILQDRNLEGTPAHEFLQRQSESDLTLFISEVELLAEHTKVTAELLSAQESRYGNLQNTEAPEQQQAKESTYEEELSVEEEPEENEENDEVTYDDEDDQGVMLDDSITVVRQTQTSLIPEDQIPDPEDFDEEGLEPEEEAEDEE